jgi:hypothetical protein
MKPNLLENTKTIIEELASIECMERGKLTSEYRTRPNPKGDGEITLGPYHKLQARENGKNKSRRVPSEEIPTLKLDIANYKKFKDLVSTLEKTIIANTRKTRASQSGPSATVDLKKTLR